MPNNSIYSLIEETSGLAPDGWSSKLLKHLATALGYSNDSLHEKITGLSDTPNQRIDLMSTSEADFLKEFTDLNLSAKAGAKVLYLTAQALSDRNGMPFVVLSEDYMGMSPTDKNQFIKEYWVSKKKSGSPPTFTPPIAKRTTKFKKIVDVKGPEEYLTLMESIKSYLVANGLSDKLEDFMAGAPKDKPTGLPLEESQWLIGTCLMVAIPNTHALGSVVSLDYHSSYILYQLHQRFDNPVVRNRLQANLMAELMQVTAVSLETPDALMATIDKMNQVFRKRQLMDDPCSDQEKSTYLNMILTNCKDTTVRIQSQSLADKSYDDCVTSLSQVFGHIGNPDLQSFNGAKSGRIREVGYQSSGNSGKVEPHTIIRSSKRGNLLIDLDDFNKMDQATRDEYFDDMNTLTMTAAPIVAKYQQFGSPSKRRQGYSGDSHSKKKKKSSQDEANKEDA
jgi:hypothetical protein